ncbi:MAG: HAD-IA family hydrolase [Candidatus Lokiarchaeota archaeon]|nr:HAD-IA family hydrolase [Candidatus Lokiarchaeota archaeon]MBD3202155.1 HAD-IA family hydrolase [Candidatus Lokiarchaeota archaeon]
MGINEIKGIIFDFGFTLYYFKNATLEKYMDCYRRGLDKCTHELSKAKLLKSDKEKGEFVKKFNERRMQLFKLSRKTSQEFPTSEILEEISSKMNLKLEKVFYNKLATLYHSCEEEEWIPFDKTKQTIKTLSKLNIKLAVLSNHPHHKTIISLLERHKLTKYFDAIITSALFKKRKPNKEIFIHTIHKMGLKKSDASNIIMCGDEYADIMGAHKLGLQKIFFLRKVKFPFEKDIPIQNYEKIKNISQILNYI